jgi:hypothetical protein
MKNDRSFVVAVTLKSPVVAERSSSTQNVHTIVQRPATTRRLSSQKRMRISCIRNAAWGASERQPEILSALPVLLEAESAHVRPSPLTVANVRVRMHRQSDMTERIDPALWQQLRRIHLIAAAVAMRTGVESRVPARAGGRFRRKHQQQEHSAHFPFCCELLCTEHSAPCQKPWHRTIQA